MVVGLLGQVGHAVDERDRGREVVELPLALDGVAGELPALEGLQPDLTWASLKSATRARLASAPRARTVGYA